MRFKNMPLSRGVIMKGNIFKADSSIMFGAESVVDVVVEGNAFAFADIALCVSLGLGNQSLPSVLLGENQLGGGLVVQCQNCQQTLLGSSATRLSNGGCKNYTAGGGNRPRLNLFVLK